MKLYFNGCSHTFGDDLLYPKTQAWPALIANNLDCDFLNDSVSGGTNDRIMYQTIKNINNFDKFYIAWTYTNRFTRYKADNNHEVNFNVHLKHSMYGNSKEFIDYGNLHYRAWHNELFAFKIWLQNIILLQSLFNQKNKSYVMLNAAHNNINRWTTDIHNFNKNVQSLVCFDNMNDDQLSTEHDEIQKLLAQVDVTKFIGWSTWWIVKLTQDFATGTTGHLLEEGHNAVANQILKYDRN